PFHMPGREQLSSSSPAAVGQSVFLPAPGEGSDFGHKSAPTAHGLCLQAGPDWTSSPSQTLDLGFSEMNEPLHKFKLVRKVVNTESVPPCTQALQCPAAPR